MTLEHSMKSLSGFLLTLSLERRSAAVHSQVAKAFAIGKQLKREMFEEREVVWVFQ